MSLRGKFYTILARCTSPEPANAWTDLPELSTEWTKTRGPFSYHFVRLTSGRTYKAKYLRIDKRGNLLIANNLDGAIYKHPLSSIDMYAQA